MVFPKSSQPRSYSVSSDLSYCGSPKADELIEVLKTTGGERFFVGITMNTIYPLITNHHSQFVYITINVVDIVDNS